MKNTLVVICSIFFAAQLSGQVVFYDSSTGKPVQGVELLLASGEQKSFHISDEKGQIQLDAAGECSASHMSFEDVTFSYKGVRHEVKLNPSLTQFDEVVITGQYHSLGQKEAVQNVRVINSEQMRSMAAIDLRDVMLRELNIDIGQDQILGTNIQMAGLAGDKVKILVNGIPVIGRVNGNIDLGQINLNDVERIEVIQGPMSVEYGTDALAGTINIITKQTFQPGTKVGAMLQHETNGRFNGNASVAISRGKNQFDFNLGRKYFDGFSINDSDRTDYWKPKDQMFAGVTYSRLLPKGKLSISSNGFLEEISNLGAIQERIEEIGINDSLSDFYRYFYARDEYFSTTRFDNNVRLSLTPGENKSLRGHVAYNYYQRRLNSYLKEFEDLSEELIDIDESQDTTVFNVLNSRMSWSAPGLSWFNYSVGYEVRHEQVTGERIEEGGQEVTEVSLFSSTEIEPLAGLKIRPGVRYTYHSSYAAPLIPSVHLRYGWNEWSFRASYGRGFRSPNLKDLYFFFVDSNHNIQGNTELNAETSDNYQVSLTREWKFEKWTISPSVRAFHNDVKDLIDLALVDAETQLYQNINISEAKTRGMNLELRAAGDSWTANIGWAYTGLTGLFGRQEILPTYNYYSQINGLVSYTLPKDIALTCNFKYTGTQQTIIVQDDGLATLETEPFALVDFFVAKPFFSDQVRISLGAKNILGVTDVSSLIAGGLAHGGTTNSPIGTGRSFVIAINYQWRK